MKNIIIGGVVRSGKTTLANLLREEFSYSKCESDAIISAFQNAFPSLNINHKDKVLSRKNYEPFLFALLDGFSKDLKYTKNVTIFPGAQFLPENLSRYKNIDNYIVIFLGLDGITPEGLVESFKTFDTVNDWTFKKDDKWLYEHCKNTIEESNKLKKDCEKFGFYYFNTFHNRQQTFDEIKDLIKKEQV